MKTILFGFLFVLSNTVMAVSYTPVTEVDGFTMGESSIVRVALKDMSQHSGIELCGAASTTEISFYSLDISGGNGDKYFSVLLAAKASKTKLFFQLSGCLEDRPKISHMYVCETLWCS